MGVRSTGRKLAMQILYQKEVRNEDLETIIDDFFKTTKYTESTMEWAITLSKNVEAHIENSDKIITEYAIDWDMSRLNPIDKNILRIAIYELQHTETPTSIILNEAIEISKKYSTEDSPKFINGVLGNFVKEKCSQE